jgi:hypothetical protein
MATPVPGSSSMHFGQLGFAQVRNSSLAIAHVIGRSRVLTLGGGFDAREGPLRAIAGRLLLAV